MEVKVYEELNHPAVLEEVFSSVAGMNKLEIRELIAEVETAIQLGEQIEVPVVHHFSQDVYAREMVLPEGSLIVGKIHRFENLNILSKGEVSILSIDGVKRIKAPHTFVGSVGAKRVILAHTDVVWTTIHGTDEKDVDQIEEKFIAKNYEQIEDIITIQKGDA